MMKRRKLKASYRLWKWWYYSRKDTAKQAGTILIGFITAVLMFAVLFILPAMFR